MPKRPIKKPTARRKVPVPAGSFMMRRVFRQGDSYYCGICRQQHEFVDDANHCLEHCWRALLNRAPWTPVKRMGKLEFACIYCQRGYKTAEQATRCAEECSSRMTISSLDGRNLAPNREKRTFAKQDFKVAVNFPFSRPGHPVVNAPLPPPELTDAKLDDAKAIVTKAPATPESADKDKNKTAKTAADEDNAAEKAPRDRTKKFERAGAKYVCVVCQKKYFEKAEVERCFDSHSGGSMDAHQNSGV